MQVSKFDVLVNHSVHVSLSRSLSRNPAACQRKEVESSRQQSESVAMLLSAVIVVITSGLTISAGTKDWHWSWECTSGVCVKSWYPTETSEPDHLGSLAVCRLTCGTFGSIWPRPTGTTVLSRQVLTFHPNQLAFKVSGGSRDFLASATSIFTDNLLKECGSNCSDTPETEVTVRLTTRSENTSLDWETDESYSIDIVTTDDAYVTVNINAATVYGTRHGLETLTQLIAGHRTGTSSTLLIVATVRLSDGPIYRHRGLLLDTGRNYLPITAIKRQIDGLAASKMNVLHWHATDSQSFPLEIPRVPQLSRYGAYSQRQVYSPAAVADLLDYARVRGVRVIMEIDAPSHAGNGWQWGESAGLGKLAVCVNQQPWRKYCIQPPCGQLNPANENMYIVLRELYKDLIKMFPKGEVFHMGGDEVFLQCWNETEEVVTWMAENGRGRTTEDFLDVWSVFQAESLKILDEEVGDAKTPVILWSSHLTEADIIDRYLDKNRYVIETWVESANQLPQNLLKKGYRIILATKDTWYLDHGFWGVTKYHNWKVAYDNRILRSVGVLGGETAMWSELVDEHNLDNKVWPRTAAAAERLWSDPNTGSHLAEARFLQHRQRLINRGIQPEAITPGWCDQNQGQCN